MTLLQLFSSWLGCYAFCRELAARGYIHSGWRVSWVLACIWWGMLLVVIVETSSLYHAFNAPVITTAWVGSTVLLACIAGCLALRRGALSVVAIHEYCVRLQQRWSQPWPVDARLYVCLFHNAGRPMNPKKDFMTLPREQQYF
jgi:hypothetical protein